VYHVLPERDLGKSTPPGEGAENESCPWNIRFDRLNSISLHFFTLALIRSVLMLMLQIRAIENKGTGITC